MASDAGILVSPSFDKSVKSRYKGGPPNLKELLRRRFKERLRCRRNDLLSQFRSEKESDKIHKMLLNEVHRDISDLSGGGGIGEPMDVDFGDVRPLKTDLPFSDDEFILQQYEKVLEEEEREYGEEWEKEVVICPQCERSTMKHSPSTESAECPACSLTVPFVSSLRILNQNIKSVLTLHSNSNCSFFPVFWCIIDGAFYSCNQCNFIHQV